MEPILHNSCPQATHAHDGHAEGALSVGGQRVLAPAEAFIEVDAVREHMAEDNPASRPAGVRFSHPGHRNTLENLHRGAGHLEVRVIFISDTASSTDPACRKV
jgi:hypothetical protein